jgi:hypothetical protein
MMGGSCKISPQFESVKYSWRLDRKNPDEACGSQEIPESFYKLKLVLAIEATGARGARA